MLDRFPCRGPIRTQFINGFWLPDGMDYKQVAKNTARVLISYLTYQAAKTVVNQLYETNPALGVWLSEFSSVDRIQDGEIYLTALMQENPELALRLMTVRADFAEEVGEYLPEMAKPGFSKPMLNSDANC